MQNSHLFQLVNSFSSVEMRDVRKFLDSPFYNTRQDLVQLFDFLVQKTEPSKTEAWQHLQPDQPFNDQKLRLLMSYLHRLLEQYISVKELSADDYRNRLHLAIGYRKRGMSSAFERSRLALEKSLVEQPMQDANFYQTRYQLRWEQYHTATADNPSEKLPLVEIASDFDQFYLSTRLRLICLAAAQMGVYQAESQLVVEAEILSMAQKSAWSEVPAVAIYLHCYRMLKSPEEETHFRNFKKLLLGSSDLFGSEELRGLYLLAINYAIKRLNEGQKSYFREGFDLYKSGLATGHILENGVLSRFTYHNVVAMGLQLGELDWVNFFIHEYKNTLERSYRESSFSFNLARLEYTRRRFDAVLELLQKANYRDPLLNLAAKTLLLKTWYELGEHDLLQSHLDAMRNYIRRKRVIGYHRTNYLNIVRFADKLLKINWMNEKEVEGLRASLKEEEVLTEREWLLGQLE
ncbi:MAG: hypothetical protein GC192_23975 [Bacteroidetes bacterium]|nr:hypothetical protein [Bacteroidota bacterium]